MISLIIKFFLAVFVFLLFFGGAVTFNSDDENWQIMIGKNNVLNTLKDGSIRFYEIFQSSNDAE